MTTIAYPVAPRVAVVCDLPLRVDYPNGFAGRYHHFVKHLAEHARIELIVPRPSRVSWSVEDVLPPGGLDGARVTLFEVPENPMNRIGRRARLLRLAHYAADPLPYMAWPRRLPDEAVD